MCIYVDELDLDCFQGACDPMGKATPSTRALELTVRRGLFRVRPRPGVKNKGKWGAGQTPPNSVAMGCFHHLAMYVVTPRMRKQGVKW